MDLELKQIGQTLALGGFTIYGLFQLISLFNPSWGSGFTFLSADQKLHESAMILAIVFATGILVEDISKNTVSERLIDSKWAGYIIDTDKQLRMESLFYVKPYSEGQMAVKPQAIYKDLMFVDHKDPIFKLHSMRISEILLSSPRADDGYYDIRNTILISDDPKHEGNDRYKIEKTKVDALEEEVNRIYYSAITRVYQESDYYNELRGIQYRGDFARSLTLICLFYSALYLILFILCYVPRKLRFESYPKQLQLFPKSRRYRKVRFQLSVSKWRSVSGVRSKRKFILLIALLYLTGIFLAKTSYRSEMTNYNLRVFGYYTSIISNNRDSK